MDIRKFLDADGKPVPPPIDGSICPNPVGLDMNPQSLSLPPSGNIPPIKGQQMVVPMTSPPLGPPMNPTMGGPPIPGPPIPGPPMAGPFENGGQPGDGQPPVGGPMPMHGFPFAPLAPMVIPPPVGGEDPQMVGACAGQAPVGDVVPPQLTPEITQMLLSGGPTPHMVTVGPTGKDEVICGSTDRRTQTRKRIERLESLNSVPRGELSAKDKEAKLRLLKLESNRRAAQVSRQKKKRYIKNLEDRARVMAKHLAELEIENNQLRSLLGEMIVTRGPPGGGNVEIPVQSAPIKLPPFPDPNELGPEMGGFDPEMLIAMGEVPHVPGALQPLQQTFKEEYTDDIPLRGLPDRCTTEPIPAAAPKPSRSGRRKKCLTSKRKLQSCYN